MRTQMNICIGVKQNYDLEFNLKCKAIFPFFIFIFFYKVQKLTIHGTDSIYVYKFLITSWSTV